MPDAQAYADQLQQLLPPGKAFPRDRDSQMGALCLGLGDEFAALDARALDLIEEADPRTTNEMLADWERTAGLPDPDLPVPTLYADRLAALSARLLEGQSPTAAAIIGLVEVFGWTATITLHTPFAAGVGYAGAPLYVQSSIFWFEVNVTAPIGTTTPVVALEHYVMRLAPDHTYPTFNYTLV